MRLLIRVGLVPDPEKPLSVVQASAEPRETAVGRWFATNLDLKTVIAGLSIAAGMLTTYVASTNTRTADHDQLQALSRKQDEDRENSATQRKELGAAIAGVNTRFDATVVSRTEYQNAMSGINGQLSELRTQNQQFYLLLAGRAPAGR